MLIVCFTYLTVFVVCFFDLALSFTSYKEKEFVKNLTETYDPRVRPMDDSSEKLHVGLQFGLMSLVTVDEKKEMLSCRGWLTMMWTDKFLKWNLTESYPFYLLIPATYVWTPTLLLINSVNDLRYLKEADEKAMISNEGLVVLAITHKFETHCKINIGKFPFDRQICEIQIGPLLSSLSGEYVYVMNSSLFLDLYEPHGEWDLVDSHFKLRNVSYLGSDLNVAAVTVILERRTIFYVLNNILPVVLLSFLNSFAFMLPEDSGEKMTLCISILLSYAIFLSVINSYLPENSDHVCFFSVYLAMLLLISTLTCLTALLILALHGCKGKNIPRWLHVFSKRNKVKSTEVTSLSGKSGESDTDEMIAWCNMVAFWIFFWLTVLSNLTYFIAVAI